jgi:mannitol-1-/sugar-/sorbitol-6-/2-deoxyglucose-6-phosphatase
MPNAAAPIEAVIFDLDGVLIDSEPLWQYAEIEVFASVGIILDRGLCRLTMGLRCDEVVAYWAARHPWTGRANADVEGELLRVVAEHVRRQGQPKPGIDGVLRLLASRGVRVALASSSPYVVITAALERLGLATAFPYVYSAEEEPYGKPHPGVYLTTAAKLGVPPLRCCAIEDSPNGVLAAKAAKMACVAIPEATLADDPRIRIADRVVSTLGDLDDAAWDALGLVRQAPAQ